jgi:hypothetical protein
LRNRRKSLEGTRIYNVPAFSTLVAQGQKKKEPPQNQGNSNSISGSGSGSSGSIQPTIMDAHVSMMTLPEPAAGTAYPVTTSHYSSAPSMATGVAVAQATRRAAPLRSAGDRDDSTKSLPGHARKSSATSVSPKPSPSISLKSTVGANEALRFNNNMDLVSPLQNNRGTVKGMEGIRFSAGLEPGPRGISPKLSPSISLKPTVAANEALRFNNSMDLVSPLQNNKGTVKGMAGIPETSMLSPGSKAVLRGPGGNSGFDLNASINLSNSMNSNTSASFLFFDEQRIMPKLDSPKEMVEALHEYRDEPNAMLPILRKIRECEFAQFSDIRVLVDALQEILLETSTDAKVLQDACGVLWRISAESDAGKHVILDAGACAALVDALRRKDDAKEFQKWSMGCLASLALSPANKIAIAHHGAIEIILEKLNKQNDNASVFLWACRCLHSLVCTYGEEENKEATEFNIAAEAQRNSATIEEGGGVPILLAAMKKNVSESLAQLWAMKLLWRLLSSSDEASRNRVRMQMTESGFMPLGIKVLRARSTSFFLFCHTSELLARLIDSEEHYDAVSECIPSVVRLMNEFKDEELIQESGCRLLVALCNKTSATRRACRMKAIATRTRSSLRLVDFFALQPKWSVTQT